MTTFALWRKLLRDIRISLLLVAVLLFGFEILWIKVVEQITTQITPMLALLSGGRGMDGDFLLRLFFRGPGKIFQTILGGENVQWGNPQDLIVVGFMHPLVQVIICIWAVGRSAGAIAGEIDRGTMELLISQPIRRSQIVLAHWAIDLVTIPVLCLALWCGSLVGTASFSPFVVDDSIYTDLWLPKPAQPTVLSATALPVWPGLLNVAVLIFAISGYTMWLSAAGRSRNRVMGLAILITLLQFIINVIGQLWDGMTFLRPFSVFYYYQPQKVVLEHSWRIDPGMAWTGKELFKVNMLLVLGAVGLVGYAMALRRFCRRDIPAPL
jgi:ABC-2 type transport system permease protein